MSELKTATVLPDVQSFDDGRQIPINQVGISKVPYPIQFTSCRTAGEPAQSTMGTFDMFVSLPSTVKGTHMSRFVQLLRDFRQPLDYCRTIDLCGELRQRLKAEEASITVRFPFFVKRTAPVTSEPGLLRLDIELSVLVNDQEDLVVRVAGPATSLCPCSKEIAAYGAHNQRCQLSASVRFRDLSDCLSIDELFVTMEQAASASVYPTVKRIDEKYITERAYENPKFVEDTVRDLALRFRSERRISWFCCSTENFESIHQHNAFARIEMDNDDHISVSNPSS
ncbi:GTP cyclohydrolase FolE2 [Roseiconus lacunae]|uniref:GTP cyclohydrolase FolE2 n=1 Tax=Roseiconus lacunae TaxID=2605694 RepID=UPI001E57BE6C|nr:GTP cyclohydrolase FolE2 [Roseiconus lacunae]MCD0463073.1 GTP cyclohydrolase FolE2 [Roseiconus lacunae]